MYITHYPACISLRNIGLHFKLASKSHSSAWLNWPFTYKTRKHIGRAVHLTDMTWCAIYFYYELLSSPGSIQQKSTKKGIWLLMKMMTKTIQQQNYHWFVMVCSIKFECVLCVLYNMNVCSMNEIRMDCIHVVNFMWQFSCVTSHNTLFVYSY